MRSLSVYGMNSPIFSLESSYDGCAELVLVCGPGSERMGEEIAGILGVEPVVVEHRAFPDGESRLRVAGDFGGRDVVLVHSTTPPQDVRLVQLLFTLDVLREWAESVTVVAPYLAYARQDRRQAPGEAVSISTVIRLLIALGVSKLVTVNVHNPEVFERLGLVLRDVSAIPLLAGYYRERATVGASPFRWGRSRWTSGTPRRPPWSWAEILRGLRRSGTRPRGG